MNYNVLTTKLSEKIGLDKNIFKFPNEIKPIEGKFIELKNEYCKGYYYIERVEERWKSITLIIPKDRIKEVLSHLKDIYDEEREKPIGKSETDIEKKLTEIFWNCVMSEGIFRIVYRKNEDNYYTVEFAKKDEE